MLLKNLRQELLRLANKVRFITGVVEGEIVVSNRKRADLLQELRSKQFTPFPRAKNYEPAVAGTETQDDDGEAAAGTEDGARDYEYLLSMAIGSLTSEKIQELLKQQKSLEDEIQELEKSSGKSLWEKDLTMFLQKLDVCMLLLSFDVSHMSWTYSLAVAVHAYKIKSFFAGTRAGGSEGGGVRVQACGQRRRSGLETPESCEEGC